jgi:hypothetical protein
MHKLKKHHAEFIPKTDLLMEMSIRKLITKLEKTVSDQNFV